MRIVCVDLCPEIFQALAGKELLKKTGNSLYREKLLSKRNIQDVDPLNHNNNR